MDCKQGIPIDDEMYIEAQYLAEDIFDANPEESQET